MSMIVKRSVLEKARTNIVFDEPFYATLMMNLKVVEGETLPGGGSLWLGATDGQRLFINPKNFEALTVPQAVFVLKHELMHVALLHPFRVKHRSQKKWNHATDYVINATCKAEGNTLLENVLLDARFTADMAAEHVYSQLPEPPPEGGEGGGQGGGQGGDQGGGQPGEGDNPLDDDVLPAPDDSDEAMAEAVGNVVQAAMVAKMRGKLPSWVKSMLGDLLEPKVQWEESLRRFLTEVTKSDFSFARPNRRFISQGLYLPGRHGNDGMGKLAVVFDTSGSVSMDEMRRFATEVVEIVNSTEPTGLVVVYCDSEVQHVDEFNYPSVDEVTNSLERHGGGGTDMTVALDWLDDNTDSLKAALVFTDGYTPFGPERSYPVLWAVTSPNVTAGMGETLYVEVA